MLVGFLFNMVEVLQWVEKSEIVSSLYNLERFKMSHYFDVTLKWHNDFFTKYSYNDFFKIAVLKEYSFLFYGTLCAYN